MPIAVRRSSASRAGRPDPSTSPRGPSRVVGAESWPGERRRRAGGVAYWRAPRHRRCHGAHALVVERHPPRRATLPLRAASRRFRLRRRDRRRRPHRRLGRLLPRGSRPDAADRGARTGDSGVRREWTERRMVLGAAPDESDDRWSPPRTRRSAGIAVGDARHGRRGRPRRRRRGDRLPLHEGRHDRPRPVVTAGRAPSRRARRVRRVRIRRR